MPSAPSSEKKRLFFPLFVSFLLVFSVLGVVFSSYTQESSSSDRVSYGEYAFRRDPSGLGWTTTTKGVSFVLWHLPDDVSSLDFPSLPRALWQSSKVYLSRPSETSLALAERDFYQNLRPTLPLFLACPVDSPACSQMPLRTCADASAETFVVQFEVDEQPSFEQEEFCLVFRGDPQALTRFADRFIYEFYGILSP